ncbi:MAG: efflux RND transporter periplasmic adaptor subunit [Acidobacteriota bacterium]
MRGTLLLKAGLPPLVLALGGLVALVLYWARPAPEAVQPGAVLPWVRVERVHLQTVQPTVHSQGTVVPRTESVLVSEVAGRITEVSPSFSVGGFFEAGDLLVRVDPSDYERRVTEARAEVTRRQMSLEEERASAEVAREEWQELGEGEPTPLTLHQPQVAEAEAALAAARAMLEQARREVDRTRLRAPYAGRVREKHADVGQYVTPGTPIGTLYAVDYAEVRLPVPDQELAYLDLPLGYRGEPAPETGPPVRLTADFAGQVHAWQGRIVRTEGEIDPKSRMVMLVARVKDPYGRGGDPDRPPLAVGMFVNAEIQAREFKNVAVVPRGALRGTDRVVVVDQTDRLRFRPVQVLRRTGDEVYIGKGLEEGDRICLSLLEPVTEGMRVRARDS